MESQNWYDFNNLSGQPNIGDQLRAGRNQLLKIGGTALGNFTEATEALDQKYMPWRKDLLDKGSEAWGNAVTNLTNNERVGRIAKTTSRITGEIFAPDSLDAMLAIGTATVGVMAPEPVTSIAGAAYLAGRGRKIISKGRQYLEEFKKAYKGTGNGGHGVRFSFEPALVDGNLGDLSKVNLNKVDNTLSPTTFAIKGRGSKVDAYQRYRKMLEQGHEFDPSVTTAAEKLSQGNFIKTLGPDIKVYKDEAKYRKAVDDYLLANPGDTKGIRTNVGVYTDDNDVFQIQKRGKLQLRSIREAKNTALNRQLSLNQQTGLRTDGTKWPNYNSTENVEMLMKKNNFKGTKEEFLATYDIHHKRSAIAYQPFFEGLNAKQSKQLRELAAKEGIHLGNKSENLIAVPKHLHTEGEDAIHNWMRANGIEGFSKEWEGFKGTYDPQGNLTKRFKNLNVKERFEALKEYQEWVQKPTDDRLNTLLEQWNLLNISDSLKK